MTVGKDGHPSARTVSLKRLERDALLFSSALWTRKAQEIAENPHVALLFHWPALGLMNTTETPPPCPEDWGAIRVTPNTIELRQEAPDRIHDRLLYERNQDAWRQTRLAP